METQNPRDFHLLPSLVKALLIGSLLLGICFRFYHLDQKIYSHDETFSTTLIFDQHSTAYELFDNSVISVNFLKKYQYIAPHQNLSESIKKLLIEPYVFPPLYPMAVRLWAEFWSHWFDNPVSIQRSFSAFISLFALISIYWLCRELFESQIMAWLAMTLVAISPFHLQYAQVVRPYSLLTVATLLSSASLLRAMRVKTKISFVIYALTVTIGLYSNVLFGFVLIAHTTYNFIIERFRLSSASKSYSLALIVGVVPFLPWFWLFINSNMPEYSVGQVNNPIPLSSLFKSWVSNIRPIFVDFYDPWVDYTQILRPLQLFLSPTILVLVGVSFYFIVRETPKRFWLFIFTLVGMTGIIIMAKDLISGGSVSTRLRYLIPYVLSIEIAVAYFIASQLKSNRYLQRQVGKVVLSALILSGVISCIIISQANSWWAFGSPQYPMVARTINQANRPLVITDGLDRAFTLSYLLDSKVKLKLMSDTVNIPDGFSDVFLLDPSKRLRQKLEKEPDYKMELVFKSYTHLPQIPNFWRLEKR